MCVCSSSFFSDHHATAQPQSHAHNHLEGIAGIDSLLLNFSFLSIFFPPHRHCMRALLLLLFCLVIQTIINFPHRILFYYYYYYVVCVQCKVCIYKYCVAVLHWFFLCHTLATCFFFFSVRSQHHKTNSLS